MDTNKHTMVTHWTSNSNVIDVLIDQWYFLGKKVMYFEKHRRNGLITDKETEYRNQYDKVEQVLIDEGVDITKI